MATENHRLADRIVYVFVDYVLVAPNGAKEERRHNEENFVKQLEEAGYSWRKKRLIWYE